MKVDGNGPTLFDPAVADAMSTLAETFPALRGLPGVRPFEPTLLAATHETPSLGVDARLAIRFLLWLCPREHEDEAGRALGDTFDLVEVAICMGSKHRRALAAWLRKPWVPTLRKAEFFAELEQNLLELERNLLRAEGAEIAERVLDGPSDEEGP